MLGMYLLCCWHASYALPTGMAAHAFGSRLGHSHPDSGRTAARFALAMPDAVGPLDEETLSGKRAVVETDATLV